MWFRLMFFCMAGVGCSEDHLEASLDDVYMAV